VRDIGADGVDIDFEPSNPDCRRGGDERIACRSDARWQEYVSRLRAVLPRPFLLTVPGWSVGAYGEGRFADARPPSPWTGSMLSLLRSDQAANLDLVSIMAYDAGPAFDPLEALAAYREHWKGPLALGVQVMPPIHGGPRMTADAARSLMK